MGNEVRMCSSEKKKSNPFIGSVQCVRKRLLAVCHPHCSRYLADTQSGKETLRWLWGNTHRRLCGSGVSVSGTEIAHSIPGLVPPLCQLVLHHINPGSTAETQKRSPLLPAASLCAFHPVLQHSKTSDKTKRGC